MSEAPDLVAQLAASHMGVEPPPSAAAPPAQTEAPKTPTEQAVEAGSPKDERDAMSDDAILYDVGGRKLTPQQISSTMDRYRDLNFKHQEFGDLHKVAEIAGKLGMGNNPREVAQAFAQMLREKANQPSQTGGDQGGLPEDDELTKWEEENAAKLPPGYRELQSNLKNFGAGQQQMMDLIRQTLAQSGQVAGAAADTAVQARQQKQDLMKQRIQHNLESTAQATGLTPEHAKDFMMFAGERGYTVDDFIDPRLVGAVMQDFKANMQTPEMDRLRAIAAKRQAFTGNISAAPTGSNETPAVDPKDSRLSGLVDDVMKARGG